LYDDAPQLSRRPAAGYPSNEGGGWQLGLWSAFYVVVAFHRGAGFDSHAYWGTRSGLDYSADPGQHDAYHVADPVAERNRNPRGPPPSDAAGATSSTPGAPRAGACTRSAIESSTA
jgi:hypothetical protein